MYKVEKKLNPIYSRMHVYDYWNKKNDEKLQENKKKF